MTQPTPSEVQVQNFLSAITDALLENPNADLRSFAAAYDLAGETAEELITLVKQLYGALVGIQPNKAFARRLGNDLRGQEGRAFSSIRHLPTRVQLAAGITVVAGFVFYSRRRLHNRAQREAVDLPVFEGR